MRTASAYRLLIGLQSERMFTVLAGATVLHWRRILFRRATILNDLPVAQLAVLHLPVKLFAAMLSRY
jgi:hypothetical protein